jgi:hypothetical protein
MSDGNTSSEKQPAVCSLRTPTDTSTLKQLWLQEKTTEFPFNEFRLNGIPESLKTFVDRFLEEDGGYDDDRLIWTSKNAFVCVGVLRPTLPGVYRNHRFELRLTSDSRYLPLYIHSTTLENAMSCLDLLVGLHDDNYDEMRLIYRDGSIQRLCPLTSVLLEKMLQQNAKRKNVFNRMTFTPDQSRTLATSGTRTDIELNRCKFQDEGAAFLEALAARADPQTGLTKLTIWYCLPFAQGIFVLLLNMLKCLTLHYTHLESEEACRAVAEAELQYLKLHHCKLGDGGASLVESVQVGRGPKGLSLGNTGFGDYDWRPFDSSERIESFMSALRNNTYLERLDLPGLRVREEGILDALTAALFENKGLVHLGLEGCCLNKKCFCKLLSAISEHPSLRTLDLTNFIHDMATTEATKAVAKMLSDNRKFEEIRLCDDDDDSPFDSSTWYALVTPRLECNIYRKRVPAIQEIGLLSTRAAVLASALAHVSNKPWLVWTLVSQNHDILASYLPVNRAHEHQIAILSRKRDRSPSFDAIIACDDEALRKEP